MLYWYEIWVTELKIELKLQPSLSGIKALFVIIDKCPSKEKILFDFFFFLFSFYFFFYVNFGNRVEWLSWNNNKQQWFKKTGVFPTLL